MSLTRPLLWGRCGQYRDRNYRQHFHGKLSAGRQWRQFNNGAARQQRWINLLQAGTLSVDGSRIEKHSHGETVATSVRMVRNGGFGGTAQGGFMPPAAM
jgi:hypothetical protein